MRTNVDLKYKTRIKVDVSIDFIFFTILNYPMFEKNPLTLALIVVIIILAFMLYCGNN